MKPITQMSIKNIYIYIFFILNASNLYDRNVILCQNKQNGALIGSSNPMEKYVEWKSMSYNKIKSFMIFSI